MRQRQPRRSHAAADSRTPSPLTRCPAWMRVEAGTGRSAGSSAVLPFARTGPRIGSMNPPRRSTPPDRRRARGGEVGAGAWKPRCRSRTDRWRERSGRTAESGPGPARSEALLLPDERAAIVGPIDDPTLSIHGERVLERRDVTDEVCCARGVGAVLDGTCDRIGLRLHRRLPHAGERGGTVDGWNRIPLHQRRGPDDPDKEDGGDPGGGASAGPSHPRAALSAGPERLLDRGIEYAGIAMQAIAHPSVNRHRRSLPP